MPGPKEEDKGVPPTAWIPLTTAADPAEQTTSSDDQEPSTGNPLTAASDHTDVPTQFRLATSELTRF